GGGGWERTRAVRPMPGHNGRDPFRVPRPASRDPQRPDGGQATKRRITTLWLSDAALSSGIQVAARLAAQAKRCAALVSSAILPLLECYAQDNDLVFAFAEVGGVSVAELSRRERLSTNAILYLAQQIFGALATAHGATNADGAPAPILHRWLDSR